MDSLAPKTEPRLSKTLALSAFLSALLIACGSSANALREWTCTRSDIPSGYEFRTGGNANSGAIGRLGPGGGSATDTYFSYWKQTVENPPFEAPGEVLCQVTRFVDEDAARDYVDTLSAATGLRGLPSFAWLPEDYTVAERIFATPVGARVFEIRVDDNPRIIAAVQVVDRYVQSVLQGASSGPPGGAVAADIAQALRGRTELFPGLEDE
jgi:hypothetical protein